MLSYSTIRLRVTDSLFYGKILYETISLSRLFCQKHQMELIHSDTANPDFLYLEKLLDEELHLLYPGEMGQYTPHNKFNTPIKAILVFEKEDPIACGAFKELDNHIEIKRMFVHPEHRGKGISRIVLSALENWGKSLGYDFAILETGERLSTAVKLYQTSGYNKIPNYGPYTHIQCSICMKKSLI